MRTATNPAKSAAQYRMAQAVLSGRSTDMPRKVARELVDKTSAKKRSEFMRQSNPDTDTDTDVTTLLTEAFEKGVEVGQSLGGSTDESDYVDVEENPDIDDRIANLSAKIRELRLKKQTKAVRDEMDSIGRRLTSMHRQKLMDVDHKRNGRKRNSIFLTPAVMAQLGQSGVGRILTSNPRKRKGRKNPDDASAELYEEFHGKPSEQLTEYVYEEHEHDSLAQLGELISVTVLTTTGYEAKIDAPSIDGPVNDVVQLCSSEDRRQLYFVGGNQAIDVDALGFGDSDIKDLMVIGVLTQVEYCTKKKFHKFKPVDYYHELGEETGQQPILLYDPISQLMKVAGGAYEVKDVGIVN